MDLGIDGRAAIVCASSKGLGRACATELARAGCRVVINGRDAATAERTAAEIRAETGAEIVVVVGDLNKSAVREALFAACPSPIFSSTTMAARRRASSRRSAVTTSSRASKRT